MKYVTNLYDKEFLTDRVRVRKIWACNMSQQRSSPAANVWNAVGSSIYATEEPLSKSFFFTFWQMIFEFKNIVSFTKTKQKHPSPPPPKKPNNKLPIFYRAIMVILERVNIKKTYKYLRLTDSKSSYITPSGSWMS